MGMVVTLINWPEAIRLLKNLRPEIMEYQIAAPLKDIGNLSLRMAKRSFNKKESPSGKKWQEISPTTYRFGKPRGTPPLVNTGAMKSGLMFTLVKRRKGMEVIVGTNKPYWIHHQFGRASNKLPNSRIPAPIPARPFLGSNSADRQRYDEIISRWLNKYTGKVGRSKLRGKVPVRL